MEKRNSGSSLPWSSNVKALPKQSSRYSRRVTSKKMLARAYKSIPKEVLLSKKNIGSRRTALGRKNKLPPTFQENVKEDHTLCLLLKHLRNGTQSKLPKVTSNGELRYSTNFMQSRKNQRKKVTLGI